MRSLLALFASALLVALPARGAAPPAGPGDGGRPIVIGRSYRLPSMILGDDRRINVYLPAEYAKAPDRRFPVLVLLDGGEAEDFHHISGLAQVVAFNGRTEPLIVVGVEGVDRRHDLTSPSRDPADRKLVPTGGGADAYRRFLVDELKPWIAAHYRAGREALIGESLAGLFVIETALRTPTSFDDYIAASPSLWWDQGGLATDAAKALEGPGLAGKRLYITMGDEGGSTQAALDRLVAALKAKAPSGFTWRYDPRPDERHDTIYHPAALTALRWLYPVEPKP